VEVDTSIKVLIVNEASPMRRFIKGSLKQLGFRDIIESENGEDAIGELKREKVGLIISDWNIPGMNGLELLRAVRNDDFLKAIPFMMVTADALKSNVLEAVKAGVSNFIVTPFTPDIFAEKIQAIL
jgi:two-component system chemotaxis response regulator CheY